MLNNLISISLSEKDKKIIVIIFLIFLLLVLLIGIINRLVMKQYQKESLKIDQYVGGYVKYGFVKNEREFKNVAHKKNRVLFFKQAAIPLIVLIASIVIFIIYCQSTHNDGTYIWQVYQDMFVKFEAETTTIFGMTLWADWPHVVEGSVVFHDNLDGYVAYALFILVVVFGICYISAVFNYMARNKRINNKAKDLYTFNLDKQQSISDSQY